MKKTLFVASALIGACLLPQVWRLGAAPADNLRLQLSVPVRMPDGVTLAADVYLPKEPGRYPVILIRTPYSKEGEQPNGTFFAEHGYAVVIQDVRGRFESDGAWYAFRNEAADGDVTIEWAAAQRWSNGKVATMGGSYLAIDQWLAATRHNPHLAAMVTLVSPSDLYANTIHNGGTFQFGTGVSWSVGTGRHTRLNEQLKLIPWPQVFMTLPVESAAKATSFDPDFYRDWVKHAERDAYWQALSWHDVYARLDVPVMHLGGWFDIFQEGTIENFQQMIREAPGAARAAQRLMIGPWAHGAFGPKVGEVDFGPKSQVDIRTRMLRFLDQFVRGQANGVKSEPAVEYFLLGANTWQNAAAWPPAGTTLRRYYFHGAGHANSFSGDGALSTEPPAGEPPDRFDDDPAHPVPTHGGGTCCSPQLLPWGAMDQRPVEQRPDVLVYSTPPLEADLEIAGPVEVHLFAATSAPDTDWTAKLVDVAPDGFAMNLTDGILRGRYRDWRRTFFASKEPLEPGKVYEFDLAIGNTADLFRKGHRIRLEIASSNFPRFSRNTHTGRVPEEDTNFTTAHQTVYHDGARASYVVLPVQPAYSGVAK